MGSFGQRKVAILGGTRIPFCRSGTTYQNLGNKELMASAMKALVEKFSLKGEVVDEVSLGAVIKHVSDFNLARETVLESGLSLRTPAFDIQRACGTSLEATILLANKISLGQIEVGIAGGSDTNSDVPISYSRTLSKRVVRTKWAKNWGERLSAWKGFRIKELRPGIPAIAEPRTGLTMGQHCELMAQQWNISRQNQDRLAMESHQKAHAAFVRGFYSDLVVPFMGVERDPGVRADSSMEKLAKLKPVFDHTGKGTLTAGNSTPLTDGAACVLLSSEAWAKEHGFSPLAYFVTGMSAAVNFVGGEGLLMAPVYAVAKMLAKSGHGFSDFDFYEIHEAFAAQVLCNLKAWESKEFCCKELGLSEALGSLDWSKMNVAGGSIALGHPFGASGARLVATLAKLLLEKGRGKGLISTCTAGGMGVSAILESD